MNPSDPVNPSDDGPLNRADRSGRAAANGPSALFADDRRLQQALREAGASPPGAELDALQARVLGQWRAHQPTRHDADHVDRRLSRPQVAMAGDNAGRPTANRPPSSRFAAVWHGRRLAWVGTAGLAAAAALALAVFIGRPDPALDELMQPDVLSQLAIGEM